MHGEKPVTVTAITQQIKPDRYPKVDDEATVLLTYPKSQVIIQASWNWPYSRKDMEVYGKDGYVFCLDGENMKALKAGAKVPEAIKAGGVDEGQKDPFEYFAGVINGSIVMKEFDLSNPSTNLIVVQILEAAKTSAKTGKTIVWKDFYKE